MRKWLTELLNDLKAWLQGGTDRTFTAYQGLRYMVGLLLRYGFMVIGFFWVFLLFMRVQFTELGSHIDALLLLDYRYIDTLLREYRFNVSEALSALFGLVIVGYVLLRFPHPFLSAEERRLLRVRSSRASAVDSIQDILNILSISGASFLLFHSPFFIYHYANEIPYKFIAYAGLGMMTTAWAGEAVIALVKRHADFPYRLKVLYFGGAAGIGVGALLTGYQIEKGKLLVIGGMWLLALGLVIGMLYQSIRFRRPETLLLWLLYGSLSLLPLAFASAFTAILLDFSEKGYFILGISLLFLSILFMGAGYDIYYYLPKMRLKRFLLDDDLSENNEDDLSDLIAEIERYLDYIYESIKIELIMLYLIYFIAPVMISLYGGLVSIYGAIYGLCDEDFVSIQSYGQYAFLLLITFQFAHILSAIFIQKSSRDKEWLHFEMFPHGFPGMKGHLWLRDTLYLLSVALVVGFLLNGGQPVMEIGTVNGLMVTQMLLLYGWLFRAAKGV